MQAGDKSPPSLDLATSGLPGLPAPELTALQQALLEATLQGEDLKAAAARPEAAAAASCPARHPDHQHAYMRQWSQLPYPLAKQSTYEEVQLLAPGCATFLCKPNSKPNSTADGSAPPGERPAMVAKFVPRQYPTQVR